MSEESGDVTAIYEVRYNPSYTPRRSPNAHIEKLMVDGKPTFILIKEAEAEYYEVDPQTNTIWNLVDGTKTIKEIYNEAKLSDDTLTEKEVRDVVISFAEEGTIESTESPVRRKRVEILSALQLDVLLLKDSSKSLAGLFRVTRKFIKRQELPIATGISAVGFVLFYSSFVHFFANPSLFDVAGSALLGLIFYQLVVLLPVYAVHELAHAAVCDYCGAKPRDMGTGLYYLAPFFYCDTTDAWRLSRRARIMIALAGPLSTLVISSLLVFWSFLIAPGYFRTVLEISAFFGYYGTLINFSPVIETDGYYILADLLNIPNLRDEAFSFVKRTFLKTLRRPVAAVRQSRRYRRTIMLYSVATFAWLAFFAYTTFWLMTVYGQSAYIALSSLASTALRARAFDLGTFGLNIITLAYFGLWLAGFGVMATVASKNIRMKGVKLETIHDKRVSAFLPLPSSIQRSRGSELTDKAKKSARKLSRFFSVTLEPPLCVAALKLGKVDQSLDAMKGEMQKVEESFRSLHYEFLSHYRASEETSPQIKSMVADLIMLANQFPPHERRRAVSAVSQFLRREDDTVRHVMQSAFGTVWTLELSPSDHRRLGREMFASLVAEDLGETEFSDELDSFKKRTVLGSPAIASLSSEIDKESKGVYKRPEVYQVTAFLEPVKSRLVFVGRTDKVEDSVVWLGGLYLYQAWTGYIGEALGDATLGLRSIRLASKPLTKAQVMKLPEEELELLKKDLEHMETLVKTVEDAMMKVESTYESALNFHETLTSLVEDETFDIGLYKPILGANRKHLEGVMEKVGEFRSEFGRVSKRLTAWRGTISEEHARRASLISSSKRNLLRRFRQAMVSSGWLRGRLRGYSPTFAAQVKLMYVTYRLSYGLVIGSDIAR